MSNPFEGLAPTERDLVIEIAKAMGSGTLGKYNKVHPWMARRVYERLRERGLLVGFEPAQPPPQMTIHI